MSKPQPAEPTPKPSMTTERPSRSQAQDILGDALRVGAGTGTLGLFVGGTVGIARGVTPVLWSIVTGVSWFALSSSFYGTRSITLSEWYGNEKATPTEKVKASAVAGGITGFMGGLIRGPKNIAPAAVMFTLFGAGGQFAVNKWADRDTTPKEKTSIFDHRWSPMTRLSDQQYENILEEKILRLEADISIIDDNIAALRAKKQTQPQVQTQSHENGANFPSTTQERP